MKPRMTDVVLPPTFEQTASFTPGPWQIDTTGNIGNAIKAQSGKRTYEGDDGFRAVALFMDCCSSELAATQEENRLANARLIAAAPEMLAALERAREAVSAIVLSTHSVSFDADLRAIDAAIAAAKGTA